jgi:hypothetical protein
MQHGPTRLTVCLFLLGTIFAVVSVSVRSNARAPQSSPSARSVAGEKAGAVTQVADALSAMQTAAAGAPAPLSIAAAASCSELACLWDASGRLVPGARAVVPSPRLANTSASALRHSGLQRFPFLGIGTMDRPAMLPMLRKLVGTLDCPIDVVVVVINNPTVNEEDQSLTSSPGPFQGWPQAEGMAVLTNLLGVTTDRLEVVVGRGVSEDSIASSWNHMLRAFNTSEQLPWFAVVASDVWFPPMALRSLASYMKGRVGYEGAAAAAAKRRDESADGGPPIVYHPHYNSKGSKFIPPWNMFIAPRSTLKRVGLFDENFYPAYFEDRDYQLRLSTLGVPETTLPWKTMRAFHRETSGARAGRTRTRRQCAVDCLCHSINKMYYEYRGKRYQGAPGVALMAASQPEPIDAIVREAAQAIMRSDGAVFQRLCRPCDQNGSMRIEPGTDNEVFPPEFHATFKASAHPRELVQQLQRGADADAADRRDPS